MKVLSEHLKSLKITRPTLLLDKRKVLQNIEKMGRKAQAAGAKFRPHCKTHQSAEIGSWFHDAGVNSITVSSLDMARYFAGHGWSDITVAFPINILEIDKINALAERITLNLLVDSPESLTFLQAKLKHQVEVWIKVDVGGHRVGMFWNSLEEILSLAQTVGKSAKTSFVGVLTHSGHSYSARQIDEILSIHAESCYRLMDVKRYLQENGIASVLISVGDTPCCSLAESFADVDEIRPGNFVFYDLVQAHLGACSESDIGVAVACPVVSKNSSRKQVVVYGGAVHLSKDSLIDDQGRTVYGCVALADKTSWRAANHHAPVISLSQEHGVIEVQGELFDKIAVGDILVVLPIHSCLTCDLYSQYLTLEGETIYRKQSNMKGDLP